MIELIVLPLTMAEQALFAGGAARSKSKSGAVRIGQEPLEALHR